MFVYYFVDPHLWVETFFEKDGAAENGGVNFEIRNIHLHTLVLEVEENFKRKVLKLYFKLYDSFLWMWFNGLKATEPLGGGSLFFTTKFYPSIIEFRIEEKIYTKTVVGVSRGTGGRVFLFPWERLGRG